MFQIEQQDVIEGALSWGQDGLKMNTYQSRIHFGIYISVVCEEKHLETS